jgi:hypothetical protein
MFMGIIETYSEYNTKPIHVGYSLGKFQFLNVKAVL